DRRDIFAELAGVETLRRVHALAPDSDEALFAGLGGTAPVEPAVQDPNRIVYLAFTSGTTGEPKGVMHSDNTLLANGRPMVADWKFGPDTVILSLSPMSHHIGTVAIEQMLACGGELVLDDPPPGKSRLEWIV